MSTSTEATKKRPAADEPEASAEMARIRIDPVEVAIHEAKQSYPLSAERLTKIIDWIHEAGSKPKLPCFLLTKLVNSTGRQPLITRWPSICC